MTQERDQSPCDHKEEVGNQVVFLRCNEFMTTAGRPTARMTFYDEQGVFFGVGYCESDRIFISKRLRRAE